MGRLLGAEQVEVASRQATLATLRRDWGTAGKALEAAQRARPREVGITLQRADLLRAQAKYGAARALASGRSMTVGAVVPTLDNAICPSFSSTTALPGYARPETSTMAVPLPLGEPPPPPESAKLKPIVIDAVTKEILYPMG